MQLALTTTQKYVCTAYIQLYFQVNIEGKVNTALF